MLFRLVLNILLLSFTRHAMRWKARQMKSARWRRKIYWSRLFSSQFNNNRKFVQLQKLLNIQYVEEIIDVNGMSMQELICKLVSCFIQIIGTIQANDQQHNYCIRDSLYDVFANVIKTSDPELVGGIVSAIVEDYINSPLEYQNAKAHGCFAHFVRRSVNTELRLQLSSEIITSSAQNLKEVGIFVLISAVVLCTSKLE